MSDEAASYTAGFFSGFVIMVFVMFAALDHTRSSERQKAIEAGVGYWRQVEESPETEFVYGVKPEGESDD